MSLASQPFNEQTLKAFDDTFFAHVGFSVSNAAKSLVLGVTGSALSENPGNPKLARYYRDLNRLNVAFALIADVSMLSLQSKLKFK